MVVFRVWSVCALIMTRVCYTTKRVVNDRNL